MIRRLCRFLTVLLIPVLPGVLVSQETRLTPASYLDYETVADPGFSPDGKVIVYTRRWINKLEDRFESALWIMDVDGGRNRFFTKGGNPVWSPDGTRVAYLAEGEPKGSQIFVRWVDRDGPPTQVTREEYPPSNIGWSPDSKSIAFARFVPKVSAWKIDLPTAPKDAKWTAPPRFVDRLHYRQDRIGYTEPGGYHLFQVAADGSTPRQLTRGDWSLGARFDGLAGGVNWSWSPDGRTIVADGYRGEDADLNYRDAHLFAIDVVGGEIRQLTKIPGTWHQPVFSPDGKTIAYTGYERTRKSYRAEDLHLMDWATGASRMVSGDFDRDPENLVWAPDGKGVYFTADNAGTVNIHYAGNSGGVRPVTTGTHLLSLGAVSRSQMAVGVRTSYHKPPDIVTVNLRKPAELVQLTTVNDDLLAGRQLGEVEEIWISSSGGARVQGWLVRPPGFDPAKQYPLVMEIHGGPHGTYNVGFNSFFQWFAAGGYLLLYTNPRGSTGYGTDFGNAIERAYPSVDYDDLMAAVDTIVGRGIVDQKRMYVGGCSGGGVLSSWVIGHTDRFAAAAVRCPVSNWLSFVGHADVPLFTQNFFDRPFWEDPAPWLRQSSLMHVGKVTTPTVVMTGVLDQRTPMPQSEEFFAALVMRGVPAALLRFEGEWHGTMSRPSNAIRTFLYMDSWYQKYTR